MDPPLLCTRYARADQACAIVERTFPRIVAGKDRSREEEADADSRRCARTSAPWSDVLSRAGARRAGRPSRLCFSREAGQALFDGFGSCRRRHGVGNDLPVSSVSGPYLKKLAVDAVQIAFDLLTASLKLVDDAADGVLFFALDAAFG